MTWAAPLFVSDALALGLITPLGTSAPSCLRRDSRWTARLAGSINRAPAISVDPPALSTSNLGDYPVLDLGIKSIYSYARQAGAALLLCFAIVGGGGVYAPSHASADILPAPTEHGIVANAHEIIVAETAIEPEGNLSSADQR